MAGISLTGQDTVSLNNRVLVDFADQNCAELTYPNELSQVKTGKNGNSIFAQNTSGRQADLKLRLLRASNDDKFLNDLLEKQDLNFSGTVLLFGQFIKKVGDGRGNITNDTYNVANGVFVKRIEARTNSDGETEQSIAIYTIRFANAPRTIG